MRPAPITVSVTIPTRVPREYVWRAFESAPRWPEVLHDLAAAEIEPDGRLVPGAVMRSRAVPGTMAVDMAYRVLDAVAPERLRTQSDAAGFTAVTDYRFAPEADGVTEITLNVSVAAQKAMVRLYIAVQRARHEEMVTASLHRRMQSMLALAEKIWKEETA
jgi:hypothetical protein